MKMLTPSTQDCIKTVLFSLMIQSTIRRPNSQPRDDADLRIAKLDDAKKMLEGVKQTKE